MPLYFAYGANMDRSAMKSRCPGSRVIGLAKLPRHRFLITLDGYASVVRDPRQSVHGVLWELALADVPVLDRFEDVARGLYVKLHQPVISQTGVRRALIYVGRSSQPGRPRPGYLEAVIAAARDNELPRDYIESCMRPDERARPALHAPSVAVRSAGWTWSP
jgi:gamma-glutamylcyclotransferase (GGCT)/AIG2-like uncharacterized protein YtfP